MSTPGQTRTIQLPAVAGKNPTATLLASADMGVCLVYNNGPNTVWIGNNNAIIAAESSVIPLSVNSSIVATGDHDVYGVVAAGAPSTIFLLDGAQSFFAPTSLSGLGGVAIYNTPLAPTQPPTIPLNSLWFTPTGGIEQWNGSAWVPQEFDGQQIIVANSITVNELAAGIVYAGIIDGTLIQGAQFRVKNGFGATIMTLNISAGAFLQYIDTGSVTQGYLVASSTLIALTDEFGNSVLGGQVTYWNPSAGVYFAVQTYQGNVNFLNGSLAAGPWNIYSSLEPAAGTGAMGYFDNGGNLYNLGNRAVRNNAVPVTISSTTLGTILTIGPLLVSGQGYHIVGQVLYIGNQAAGAPIFSFAGSGGLVLGAQQNGFQRFSGGGVAPIIHNNNGALGAVTGPAFAANTTNWLYEFDIYVTVTTAGSLLITAAENTAGDSFVLNQVYAMTEHY